MLLSCVEDSLFSTEVSVSNCRIEIVPVALGELRIFNLLALAYPVPSDVKFERTESQKREEIGGSEIERVKRDQ